MNDDGDDGVFQGLGGEAGDFGVSEAVESELRREFFNTVAGEDEVISHLGGAQIVDVESAVVIHDFSEAQPNVGAFGSFEADPFDAGEILAEVVDVDAGLGLRSWIWRRRFVPREWEESPGPGSGTDLGWMAIAVFHLAALKAALDPAGLHAGCASWVSPS